MESVLFALAMDLNSYNFGIDILSAINQIMKRTIFVANKGNEVRQYVLEYSLYLFFRITILETCVNVFIFNYL